MFQLGQSLQDARHARRLELADVARATMIRARYLAALEAERFDLLPGDVYVRLFLREYAAFLGLDPELFLDQLAARVVDTEPLPLAPPLLPQRRRLGGRTLLVTGGAVAAATIVSLVAWELGGGEQPQPPAEQTSLRAEPSARVPVRRASPSRRATKPSGPHLRLSAVRGPVWLLVREGSSDGRVLYEDTLEAGRSLPFGRRPLWVRIGAPWNLDVLIKGRPTPIPPSSAPENILVTETGRLLPA